MESLLEQVLERLPGVDFGATWRREKFLAGETVGRYWLYQGFCGTVFPKHSAGLDILLSLAELVGDSKKNIVFCTRIFVIYF